MEQVPKRTPACLYTNPRRLVARSCSDRKKRKEKKEGFTPLVDTLDYYFHRFLVSFTPWPTKHKPGAKLQT